MIPLLRFGVIAALPAEAASCQVARWTIACGGVGPVAATRCADGLLQAGATALVSWGTAGALDATLNTAHLAVYDRCIDAENGEVFQADAACRRHAAACLAPLGATICTGLSSPHPLVTAQEKSAAQSAFGCAVVDMETAAIAALARRRGVPFIAIRAIVDPATCVLPGSALAGLTGDRGSAWRVAAALARRPLEIGSLLRLAWWYRRALGALRAAAGNIDAADWSAPYPREEG